MPDRIMGNKIKGEGLMPNNKVKHMKTMLNNCPDQYNSVRPILDAYIHAVCILREINRKATEYAFQYDQETNPEYWDGRNANASSEWQDNEFYAADQDALATVASKAPETIGKGLMDYFNSDPENPNHWPCWTMGPEFLDRVPEGSTYVESRRGSAYQRYYLYLGQDVVGYVSNIILYHGELVPLRRQKLEELLSTYYKQDIKILATDIEAGVFFDINPASPWMEGRLNIQEDWFDDQDGHIEMYPSGRQPEVL